MVTEIPSPPEPLTDWIQLLYWLLGLFVAALAIARAIGGKGIVWI